MYFCPHSFFLSEASYRFVSFIFSKIQLLVPSIFSTVFLVCVSFLSTLIFVISFLLLTLGLLVLLSRQSLGIRDKLPPNWNQRSLTPIQSYSRSGAFWEPFGIQFGPAWAVWIPQIWHPTGFENCTASQETSFQKRRRESTKKYEGSGASLVAQRLRICLPMQGTRVRALVWEDPTCRGATGLASHNYWACASGARAPQQERPWQWEARAPRWRVAPACHN